MKKKDLKLTSSTLDSKSMSFNCERQLCEDNIIRWLRTITKKQNIKQKQKAESSNEECKLFDNIYKKLSLEYLGEELHFVQKEFSHKKIMMIMRVLSNLRDYKITDIELFLRSQFTKARHNNPRVIWPTYLVKLHSIKIYQEWLSEYKSQKDAKTRISDSTLEEIIKQNHKIFHYYKLRTGLSDLAILKIKARDFDPIYLASYPEFNDTMIKQPETLSKPSRKRYDEVLKLLTRPDSASKFLELARRVKCQEVITS